MPDTLYVWLSTLFGLCLPNEDTMKPKKTKNLGSFGLPKKTYWHLYSLQTMDTDKLVRTVNKVLRKEYVLIK